MIREHRILVEHEGTDNRDPVTCSKALDPRSHSIDRAGSFVAEGCRKLRFDDVSSSAIHAVCTVEPLGADPDADLSGLGLWCRNFVDPENFRTTNLVETNSACH